MPRIDGGPYVFSNDGQRPIGGLARLKAKFDRACGVTGWTLHDLRRTARSLMSRAAIDVAGANWISREHEHNRYGAGRLLQRPHGRARREDHVWCERD